MAGQQGGCSCGQVRFEIAGLPRWIVVCHCDACKKRTGSAFGVSAVVAKADIAAQDGELQTYTRVGDSGREVHYEFCPQCATTVRWHIATVDGVAADSIVYACGAFDDWQGLTAAGEMYADYKVPWVDFGYDLSCSEAPDDAFRSALIARSQAQR